MKLARHWKGAVGVGAFVLLLLFLTLTSAPKPPPRGVGHTAGAAAQACEREVRLRVAAGQLPFAPTVTYLGEARYRLRGYVDAREGGGLVRRNYECVVRYAAGAYRADSVRVWQSH